MDVIFLAVLGTLLAWFLSFVTSFDYWAETYETTINQYEKSFGINFEISEQEYLSFSQEQRNTYDLAYDTLIGDEIAMKAYNMVLKLSLIIASASIFIAYAILEFIVPLFLKNGMTVGKKVFGIALMNGNYTKVTPVVMFARTFLGKYALETMIPVLLFVMFTFNITGALGIYIIGLLLLIQIILILATKNHSALHDLLCGTIVVDYLSQRIFDTYDDMISYKEKVYEETINRRDQ
ncbi:MAG: RDD family protein [Sphaerochaetaceae bacterium]|nr:RDD family protein [Sphaerochaetaceae bacterium]